MAGDKVGQVTREAFRHQVEVSREKRDKVRSMVARGQSTRADEDEQRLSAVLMRKQARGGKEALQGLSNDLQPIAFMTEGAAVRRAVAKVVVDTDEYHEEGSGFSCESRSSHHKSACDTGQRSSARGCSGFRL